MKLYFTNLKENYRFTLFLAILLHVVLLSVLFLNLRNAKPLFLNAAAPAAIIHATALDSVVLPNAMPNAMPIQKTNIKTISKAEQKLTTTPLLIEKSPVALPIKEKKIVKKPVINTTQEPTKPRLKTATTPKKKQITPLTQPKLIEKEKNTHPHVSRKSLQIVQKNVQQLLQQEVSTSLQKNQLAARNAAAITKYRHLILQSIASQWIIPPDVDKHLETKLLVSLSPGGMVLKVIITKGSGNSVLDRSVQSAVYKASPLPVPKESGLFNNFRQINLTVRPEGFIT